MLAASRKNSLSFFALFLAFKLKHLEPSSLYPLAVLRFDFWRGRVISTDSRSSTKQHNAKQNQKKIANLQLSRLMLAKFQLNALRAFINDITLLMSVDGEPLMSLIPPWWINFSIA